MSDTPTMFIDNLEHTLKFVIVPIRWLYSDPFRITIMKAKSELIYDQSKTVKNTNVLHCI